MTKYAKSSAPLPRLSSATRNPDFCAGDRTLGNGFTLIELLVVVAVIALLASLLLPTLKRARMEGRKVLCLNNHRQAMVTLFTYASDWNEFPCVLDWTNVNPDPNSNLPYNMGETICDNRPGGLCIAKSWANGWGVAIWVLLRQQGYIKSYQAYQCPIPFASAQPYYNRHLHATNSTGGYAFEPHGSQRLSCLDPCWGGGTWADFWMIGGTHYVERVVGFADGRAIYDNQVTPHDPNNCPEKKL